MCHRFRPVHTTFRLYRLKISLESLEKPENRVRKRNALSIVSGNSKSRSFLTEVISSGDSKKKKNTVSGTVRNNLHTHVIDNPSNQTAFLSKPDQLSLKTSIALEISAAARSSDIIVSRAIAIVSRCPSFAYVKLKSSID